MDREPLTCNLIQVRAASRILNHSPNLTFGEDVFQLPIQTFFCRLERTSFMSRLT